MYIHELQCFHIMVRELYEYAASFVDVHHTGREEHIHSTAASGPVHCGKSEDALSPQVKWMKTCTFI